jgi:hypothetical protein
MKSSRLIAAVCSLLLLGSAAGQIWRKDQLPVAAGSSRLWQVLPDQITGWKSQELSLGGNEAVNDAVGKTLRFDGVYFRSTQSTVSVYAAYWGPSKMPVQLVASHTPDRWWV